MGGGLMQLVAYGAQDIYLTGNPQITFFKVVYRRHTNFSMEAIEQTFNGSVGYGNKVTATISRNGDLVSRMYVEHTVTQTSTTEADKICAAYGNSLLKEVDLEIGGQRIDRHYSQWLQVWSELTEPNPTGAVGATSATTGARTGTKYQVMSGNTALIDVTGTTAGVALQERMFIPLQFWFCRNPGLALPLIALQYHEVKVSITTETVANLIETEAQVTFGDFKLWTDYIYLDTDERRRFAQVSHEYLIEQLQKETVTTAATGGNVTLNFNHPVKELVWCATGETDGVDATGTIEGPAVPTAAFASGDTAKLTLNGHDRFAARDMVYFTRAQIWQHHTGYGGTQLKDSIAVYSFALKPEEHQPSGTCNFSRIDNARLEFTGTSIPTSMNVYAVNYNVLRVMSGMGGLAYSN